MHPSFQFILNDIKKILFNIFMAVVSDNKDLLKQWDWKKNKGLDPYKITISSRLKYGGSVQKKMIMNG